MAILQHRRPREEEGPFANKPVQRYQNTETGGLDKQKVLIEYYEAAKKKNGAEKTVVEAQEETKSELSSDTQRAIELSLRTPLEKETGKEGGSSAYSIGQNNQGTREETTLEQDAKPKEDAKVKQPAKPREEYETKKRTKTLEIPRRLFTHWDQKARESSEAPRPSKIPISSRPLTPTEIPRGSKVTTPSKTPRLSEASKSLEALKPKPEAKSQLVPETKEALRAKEGLTAEGEVKTAEASKNKEEPKGKGKVETKEDTKPVFPPQTEQLYSSTSPTR